MFLLIRQVVTKASVITHDEYYEELSKKKQEQRKLDRERRKVEAEKKKQMHALCKEAFQSGATETQVAVKKMMMREP